MPAPSLEATRTGMALHTGEPALHVKHIPVSPSRCPLVRTRSSRAVPACSCSRSGRALSEEGYAHTQGYWTYLGRLDDHDLCGVVPHPKLRSPWRHPRPERVDSDHRIAGRLLHPPRSPSCTSVVYGVSVLRPRCGWHIHALATQGTWQASLRCSVRPSPSLKRSATGMSADLRSAAGMLAPRGPAATPASPAQLERRAAQGKRLRPSAAHERPISPVMRP